ncbi:MAG: sulfotransferase [Lentisphaerae bacterium]|nr:sulfotransferase [Lentisphaerota bacterium]
MFFIVSQQRSGTHYLTSLLSSPANTKSFGEVISNNSKYNFYSYLGKLAAKDPDSVRPLTLFKIWQKFTHELVTKEKLDHGYAILMYNDIGRLSPVITEKILTSNRLIHLVRHNILRTHISNQINRSTTKPAHQTEREGILSRITLPTKNLVDELRLRQQQIGEMRERLSSLNCLEVSYEEITQNPDVEAAKIFSFLRLPVTKVSTNLKRSNPHALDKILENYSEVREHLTRFEMEHFCTSE